MRTNYSISNLVYSVTAVYNSLILNSFILHIFFRILFLFPNDIFCHCCFCNNHVDAITVLWKKSLSFLYSFFGWWEMGAAIYWSMCNNIWKYRIEGKKSLYKSNAPKHQYLVWPSSFLNTDWTVLLIYVVFWNSSPGFLKYIERFPSDVDYSNLCQDDSTLLLGSRLWGMRVHDR